MSTADKSFLGTGWSFPPTFSRDLGGVVMVSDNLDIQQSLWVLFSTVPGERVMVPEYGCDLWRMVFRALTTTLMRQMEDYVRQAILYWEPRITVDQILVQADATVAGLVWIDVSYVINQTNTRSNLVYPFYAQEGNLPAQGP